MDDNKEYFKLGPKASMFWDPSQPDGNPQKVTKGQVVALEMTENVESAVRNKALVPATKAEITAAKDAAKATAEKTTTTVTETKTVTKPAAKTETTKTEPAKTGDDSAAGTGADKTGGTK